ncbi:MAG: sodium/proline symporter [Sphingobacteriales bacterium]|nr:sodium/proline symporter [Sphingobacteriales bacterium]
MTIQIIVICLYLVFILVWGFYHGRKVKSSEDFAIAGRGLPGWAAALSERAAGESSWALLGLPGAAYATGLTEIWTAIGCVAGIITAWVLIAWRLRNAAEHYKVSTFTELLARFHPDTGKWLKIVVSLTIVFFFFLYVGAQLIGGGKTFNSLFEIKPVIGMLIMMAIVVPYTIYGGFRSVVYADVIQAVIMIIALIAGPVVGIWYIAHHPELFAQNIPDAIHRAGDTYSSLTGAAKGYTSGVVIATGFSWFFGYLGGMPQLSMRFMAIKDHKHAKMARNIGVIWTIIAYTGALCIGWIGIAVFGPQSLDDQEKVMPELMKVLFHPAFSTLLITGVIAAMLSTADSLLILSATELSENIIKPLSKNKNAGNDRHSLFKSRLITLLLAMVALVFALLTPQKLIFNIVGYVWAGVGCTFSVVILFSLFWKRFHGKAALITAITGLLLSVVWISTGMSEHFNARILVFLVCILVAWLSTLLIKSNKENAV